MFKLWQAAVTVAAVCFMLFQISGGTESIIAIATALGIMAVLAADPHSRVALRDFRRR